MSTHFRDLPPLLRNALLASAAASIGIGSAAAGKRLAARRYKTRNEGDTMEKFAGISKEELEYLFDQGLEKIAEDAEFEDAIVKIAEYTGLTPEYLGELLFSHCEELEKVAAIEQIIDELSDEEVEELLEEAAQNPELAQNVAAAEEERENEELAYLAALVDELGEEEAQELLQEIVKEN